MLRPTKLKSGKELYTISLVNLRYVNAPGEPPGYWHPSRAAKELGLSGQVKDAQYLALHGGKHPQTGERLGQLQEYNDPKRTARIGWDFTIKGLKGPDVRSITASSKERRAFVKAHKDANAKVLSYLETLPLMPRGHAGERMEQASLVFSCWPHLSARGGDPCYHTHCYLAPDGLCSDGKWRRLEPTAVFKYQTALSRLHEVEFVRQIRIHCGWDIERDEDGRLGVVGIPKEVERHFSKRAIQIEKAVAAWEEEHGHAIGPKERDDLIRAIRPKKDLKSLRARVAGWREELAGIGYENLQTVTRDFVEPSQAQLNRESKKALSSLAAMQGSFTRMDLLAAIAYRVAPHGYTIAKVEASCDRLIRSRRVAELGKQDNEVHYAAAKLLGAERRFLSHLEVHRRCTRHNVSEKQIRKLLVEREGRGKGLWADQKIALRHMVSSRGRIHAVTGLAGTGKTYTVGAAAELWRKRGLTVIGCSLSGRAADELQASTGMRTYTVARLLQDFTPTLSSKLSDAFEHMRTAAKAQQNWRVALDKKSVLLIDEAGMLGSAAMEKLLREARKKGALVVCVGDAQQLQPIEAGAPFKALVARLGDERLTTIARQEETWQRKAVANLEKGNAQAAVEAFHRNGCLSIQSPAKSKDALVASWAKERTGDLAETLVIAGRRSDVLELNQKLQAERVKSGELRINGSALTLPNGERVHLGDRLEVRVPGAERLQPSLRAGEVRNAARGTVISVSQRAMSVAFDGQTAPLQIPRAAWSQVCLGYATTVHRSQGATVDRCFSYLSQGMTDRHLAYVALSRSREQTKVWSDLPRARLARAAAKSRQKNLILEFQETLQQER